MAKGYNPTEYMYSSARIRALETGIITGERILRFTEAENSQNIISALADCGFEMIRDESDNRIKRAETLESALAAGYDEISSMECAGAVDFLRYQYDANNIKAVIKCNARSISPDGMMCRFGTVPPDGVKRAFEDKDYFRFPKHMAEAIPEAEEAFAATANPQKIDFIIDKACFADMLCVADDSGIELAKRLVRLKIDTVNVMMTLRIMRMKLGKTSEGILREVYIPGGSFDCEELVQMLDSDEETFAKELLYGDCADIGKGIIDGATLGTLERLADDIWMHCVKEAKYVSFGAEIAIGYVAALEYAVKNIRIVLAGKDAGLKPDVIRERLRECYV